LFVQANKLGIEEGDLVSYNDEISIRCACPELAGIEGAIDGRVLYNLLQKSTAETLTIKPEDGGLTVRGGRMTARFAVQPLDLPLAEIEAGDERFVLPDRFGDALRLVSRVCATDLSRPALNCVRLTDGYIEGGDGYRLARVASIRLPEALLPARAAKQIADYDPTALIIGPEKRWLHFENADGVRISSRLYDETYPDVSSLFHYDGALEFSFPESLAAALHRAAAFTRGLAHEDEEVRVTLRRNQIVIEVDGVSCQFDEVLRWDRTDVNAEFAVHPEFLQLALRQGTHCHLDHNRIGLTGTTLGGAAWDHIIARR
jgi:hypothetical protein